MTRFTQQGVTRMKAPPKPQRVRQDPHHRSRLGARAARLLFRLQDLARALLRQRQAAH